MEIFIIIDDFYLYCLWVLHTFYFESCNRKHLRDAARNLMAANDFPQTNQPPAVRKGDMGLWSHRGGGTLLSDPPQQIDPKEDKLTQQKIITFTFLPFIFSL